MADKKISELPIVYNITASGVGLYPQNVVPVVVAGTTWQMSVQNFSKYATQYSATTGSNIFLGNQNITGDVNIVGNQTISGTLTVNTVVAQYETASVLFSSGSNKFGDQSTDKHEFTGSAYFADSIYINGNSIGAGALNQVTASLQAATASIQNFTASVNATLSRVWQTTSSLQDTTASINNYTASVNDTLSRVWQTTSSLQDTTASINNYTASVNATLSRVWQTTASLQSTSASVNTYTASVNDTLSRVWQTTSSLQSTTASINTYTASVNDTLSRVWQTTASLQSTSASVNTYTASVNDTLSRIWQTTASLQAATSSANADLGRVFQSTASLQSATASLQTYTASVNDTLSRVWQTTASLNIFTGSQDSRNFVISQFTSSTDAHIVGISAFTSSQLAVNLQNSIITSSYRIELNTIEAYTASLKNAISVSGTNVQIIGDLNVNKLNVNYVSSSVLVTSGSNIFGDQSTDKHEFTGSVYLQNSLLLGTEVLGNAGLNSFTASTNNSIVGVSAFTSSQLAVNLGNSIYTASVNNHILGVSIYTSSVNNSIVGVSAFTSSQLAVNLGTSIVTSSINTFTSSQLTVNLNNSIFTSSARIELNSIEAYTSSLKAAAIVSSSTQVQNYDVFALNSNLYNSTGSIQSEINGLMALTASMKAAAIVSSSTQVQNYNLFAYNTVTSSAATTFYGKVSIATTQSAAPLTIKEQGVAGAPLFRFYGNSSNGDYMRGNWISQDGETSLAQLTVNGTSDVVFGSSTTAPLKLYTNATNAVEINYLAGANFAGAVTASNFKVPSGGGIDFSATSNGSGTTTSELLNDYEEGDWSPQVYYQNATDQTNATNVTQVGTYIKVGRVVTVHGVLQWTITGSPANDNVGIKNLPFTAKSGSDYIWWGHVWLGNAGSYPTDGYILRVDNNSTIALFYDRRTDNSNYGDDIGATGTKTARFTITYFSAS